jgi:predicted amidohydrolase
MLKIALLQLLSAGVDQDANRLKGERYCRQAREMGADIALFPEMWNVGYQLPDPAHPEERLAWQERAVDIHGEFVQSFCRLSRELDIAIGLTYLEKWQPAPRNTISLIDRHGQIRLTYAKVHTCDWDSEAALTPGDAFHVCELDTAAGLVRVGAMICFDREFPESARLLMLQGAELILTPNACELEANRLGQYRARAYENMLAVAMANYAIPQENGRSVAFDGIAFDETGSRDTCLVQADGREGIFIAELDLDRLRTYRQNEVWGNAYRRPLRYAALSETKVEPPFLRPDARRE